MLIIPAIDLKNGKCVRLEQGKMELETVFSQDPSAIARKWESLGAKMLHLVDLDGAFAGAPQNKPAIENIVRAISIPVELGGGIRTLESIEGYLNLGVNRIILGTVVYQQKNFLSEACAKFPGRIVVGIDARNGKVAIQGWAEQTELSAVELAKKSEQEGAIAIIYTDIQRDGMLTGVNLEATRMLAQAVSIPIIASGGVATIEDIKNLLPLTREGISGVIIGRALYSGTIDLTEALSVAKGTVC
jgi:phosphoribosylformimino-5-aminoimidazole carboxamide ribotide isomerase